MITFDRLQYATLTGGTLYTQGLVLHKRNFPPFLKYQYTPNTLWLCKLYKGIFQPNCPYSYKWVGLYGLPLVSLLLDL